jgi:hypothetical protein
MPLTLTDDDLNELNRLMGDMRGTEVRMLVGFIQSKVARQTLAQAAWANQPAVAAQANDVGAHQGAGDTEVAT